ncbi:nad dependent epimerase/dehydratase, putative [Perkinsus marinus ATCC 50983]|uniref:Nad dependent epimerase/dehydratase, putative n=1 Tax=Perkinsus marinus (strain ATCC 50983 / TXsc) TaxID=423536 RepID=C5KGE8_PERM5|nr:nad dependent epimerase/dehydratase, putative [Perkinsus marinus ATCC 50983]EER16504.1 nad dependent epimerase/dehydratase, putative [Perkinsus marinus ATCC 50983]|eukprot:XP_002784708.1 nad dependent epimerase/dehydratase, putative [Perkinsus marinus ATCC 50983]
MLSSLSTVVSAKKPKVIIYGGAGFIGSRLALHLHHKGCHVTAVDHDNSQVLVALKVAGIPVIKFSSKEECDFEKDVADKDVIIMMAGMPSVRSCSSVWGTMANTVGNLSRFLACKRPKGQVLIYASSSSVYGDTSDEVVDEEYCKYKGHNYYDISKKCMDLIAEHYIRESGGTEKIYGLRFGTVCGWSLNLRSDVMVNAMAYSALTRKKVGIFVEHVHRPVLALEDLCRAVEALMTYRPDGGVYNLASVQHTVYEFGKEVSDFFNVPLVREQLVPGTRGNEKFTKTTYDFCVSTDKFLKAIPSFKFVATAASICQEIRDNWDDIILAGPRLADRYTEIRTAKALECTEVKKCRCCGRNDLRLVLDLGSQPPANSFHPATSRELKSYPLQVKVCEHCWHLQLAHVVNPDVLFRDYVYVSGTSTTLAKYSQWFADMVAKDVGKSNGVVLDVGCNDGTLLDYFNQIGWKTVGVDPAVNLMSEVTIKKGHRAICDYWSPQVARQIGLVDAVTAQNVFAHVAQPVEFLEACAEAMNDESRLYIQTSQADIVANGEFDTIYHEHQSFFSSKSMIVLAERCGFTVVRVTKPSIHGTSYIFCLRKGVRLELVEDTVRSELAKEEARGIYSIGTYKHFADLARTRTASFLRRLREWWMEGRKVVAYGAAAKAVVLLNFAGVTNELAYVVDDNPRKTGLQVPGINGLMVYDPKAALQSEKSDLTVVVLAWNFLDEIKGRVKALRPDAHDEFHSILDMAKSSQGTIVSKL